MSVHRWCDMTWSLRRCPVGLAIPLSRDRIGHAMVASCEMIFTGSVTATTKRGCCSAETDIKSTGFCPAIEIANLSVMYGNCDEDIYLNHRTLES